MKTIKVRVSNEVAKLLAVLDPEGNLDRVLGQLVDHAQQGVYRPGAWERDWIIQAFGDEWLSKMKWDTSRMIDRPVFQKPKEA